MSLATVKNSASFDSPQNKSSKFQYYQINFDITLKAGAAPLFLFCFNGFIWSLYGKGKEISKIDKNFQNPE